jgi:hypothetical protein
MSKLNRNLAVAAALLCTAAAGAQSMSSTKSYSRTLGNSYLGLTGQVYAHLSWNKAQPSTTTTTTWSTTKTMFSFLTPTESARSRFYHRATVRLMRSTAELGFIDVNASSSRYSGPATGSANYKVRVAGLTVLNTTFSTSKSFAKLNRYLPLFPVDPRTSIGVGPFSLSLKGNAGVGIQSQGTVLLPTTVMAGVHYSCYSYGQAHAEAAAGIPGFSVGAEVDAKLATQSLGADLSAVIGRSLSADVLYTFNPLRLKLIGYVKTLWKKWSTTLIDASFPTIKLQLLKL